MRYGYSCLLLVLMVVFLSAAPSGAAASGPQPVETYTGTQSVTISMPGTVNGANVDFVGLLRFTSLFFTPGAVAYQDTMIDFSGQELLFLQANYLITLSFPNSPASVVTAQGTWLTQGPAGEPYSGILTWENVELGSTFSANSFHLVTNSSFSSVISEIAWDSSSVVPELNGNIVTIDGLHTITSATPPAGFVAMTAAGTIYAEPDPTGIGDPLYAPAITLSQNYPNPFNPRTVIRFALPTNLPVNLSIFDVRGRLVATLVDETLSGTVHEVPWNARDRRGNLVGSGVYIYRLHAGERVLSKKMLLLK